MDDSSLCGIVRSLQLGDVDNHTAHTRRSNEAAILEVDLVAVDVSAFFSLSPPVLACRTVAVERAIQVGVHHVMIVFDLAVEHGSLRPRDAGVGNENVETAVEFLDNLVDHLLDMLLVSHIDLVGLAYGAIV